MPELGKVRVGFEGVATLVRQGRPVVGQALLLLANVQVDLLAAAEKTRVRVSNCQRKGDRVSPDPVVGPSLGSRLHSR